MIRPWTERAIPEPTSPSHVVTHAALDQTLREAALLIWADETSRLGRTLSPIAAQARTTNNPELLSAVLTLKGYAALRRGRVVDAIMHLEGAAALPRNGWSSGLPAPEAGLVDAYVARGELDHAMALLDPLAEVAQGDGLAAATAAAAEAALAGAQGHHDQAAAGFTHAGQVAAASDHDTPSRLPWRSGVALALTRLGRVDEARALATDELAVARQDGSSYAVATALRTLATVSTGPEREAGLRSALDFAHQVEATRLASQIATDLAAILAFPSVGSARAERAAEAAGLLHTAEPHALSQGMLPLQRRIAQLLLLLGEHGSTVAETPQLTRSERRVATLAGSGLSNHEIAGRLVVTVKAVEWHLSHIYRKLGIRGRRDLPAALAAYDRQDGGPTPPREGPAR